MLESLSKEGGVQRCSVKMVFLKISQNSQEITSARVSFLINFIKKETLAQLFLVNFAKFLRIPSPTEHFPWLLVSLMLLNAFMPSGLKFY